MWQHHYYSFRARSRIRDYLRNCTSCIQSTPINLRCKSGLLQLYAKVPQAFSICSACPAQLVIFLNGVTTVFSNGIFYRYFSAVINHNAYRHWITPLNKRMQRFGAKPKIGAKSCVTHMFISAYMSAPIVKIDFPAAPPTQCITWCRAFAGMGLPPI